MLLLQRVPQEANSEAACRTRGRSDKKCLVDYNLGCLLNRRDDEATLCLPSRTPTDQQHDLRPVLVPVATKSESCRSASFPGLDSKRPLQSFPLGS